jgi:hypothetical protein
MRERGYAGGYTAAKRAVRDIRPEPITPFEVRFETSPDERAQVDLARFEVEFADEHGVTRIVWLHLVTRRKSDDGVDRCRYPNQNLVPARLSIWTRARPRNVQ